MPNYFAIILMFSLSNEGKIYLDLHQNDLLSVLFIVRRVQTNPGGDNSISNFWDPEVAGE